jgi:peroxiredoxin
MKILYTCLSLFAVVTAISFSGLHAAAGTPGNVAIGSIIADFKLPDADGNEHSLASLKGKNGVVLIFVSTQCPVSNGYNERMEKLAQDYKSKGVALVGINANAAESQADIKRHAAEHKLSFPILKDKGNVIADRLDAKVTPEAYLLDGQSKLVYRGSIDNSRSGNDVSATHLRNAIEAVLAGKAVEKAEVNAFGCSIKRAS